ncbi:MAG: cyclic nucleotide-binding domain-containing protein [Chitinivibrionales bacterium]|nr:cyclic nucleotide-binding domain-containing protein [Chitinivibrionales bacterium]
MQPLTKTYKAGTCLFHENDHSRELYIIQSGVVRIYRKIGAQTVDLAKLTKGAVLGEMALIDGKPRSASATALEECTVFIISADAFMKKMQGVPSWFMSIIRMTSRKVRNANARLRRFHGSSQGANLILCFHYIFARYSQVSVADSRAGIELQRARKQLMMLVGATLQRAVKLFDFMQQHHFIEIHDDMIYIVNSESFAEYIDFLRSYLRKSAGKVDALPPPAQTLVTKIGQRMPHLLVDGMATVDVTNSEMWNYCCQAGVREKPLEILAALEEQEMVTKSRVSSGGDDQPLGGYSFTISADALRTGFFLIKYQDQIPRL